MAALAGFHFHFYQPPREDPWLGLLAPEWSAWPFHDWNERIATECYRAMAAVALPESDDGGIELAEPLARSSFNLGPTLHHWLARYSPDVDRALTYQVRNAPGGANRVVMAMPLVHAILPLALDVDKVRLVRWGIDDYVRRYGVRPLGMWLPETGVDVRTLEVLVDQGITYTVLMPTQALRVRGPQGEWELVTADTLDTSRLYRVELGEGRSITVMFGHHELSQSAAFGTLIDDGTHLADVMAEATNHGDHGVLLVADGETYGHHHRFGDLGVAWALRRLQRHYDIETALGEWLIGQTPTWEVELAEVSAWSCAHGVERWRSACGCVTGERPGWSLDWRAPLRDALNWLRTTLGHALDEQLATLVAAPNTVLDEYGRVIAGSTSPHEFATSFLGPDADDGTIVTLLELCEAHRNLLYSFTSCAWFFADPGEIETSIVLRYAAVAIEAGKRVLGLDLETPFVEHLDSLHSVEHQVAGRALWERACTPYRVDVTGLAAAAAAEFAVCGPLARRTRGEWHFTIESHEDGWATVVVRNTATLRQHRVGTFCQQTGPLGLEVTASGPEGERHVRVPDMGADVVARLGASWLVEPGSLDYEAALNALVAELLTRAASDDDEAVLVALASAQRYVTPIGEASIRRALLAIRGHDPVGTKRPRLSNVATAVGLGESPN